MASQKNKNDKMSRQSRNKTDNRKTPGWQFVVIGILLIILIYLIMKVFSTTQGSSDERMQNPSDSVIETMDTTTTESSKESNSNEESSKTSDSTESDEEDAKEEETELEETAPSDDLVIQAYTGDWDPVATSQEGEHTSTNFSEGSEDRIEIKKASAKATGLNEADMIEWWVGNDGPNRVLTTVSDKEQNSIYRVYMEWVQEKGWKPTKIEKLKENDKN